MSITTKPDTEAIAAIEKDLLFAAARISDLNSREHRWHAARGLIAPELQELDEHVRQARLILMGMKAEG
jgi:hypothetical protein